MTYSELYELGHGNKRGQQKHPKHLVNSRIRGAAEEQRGGLLMEKRHAGVGVL